jgi:hypothetical protein
VLLGNRWLLNTEAWMATSAQLPKSIKRITLIRADAQGVAEPQTIYRLAKKRKKQSAGLKFFEKLTRRNLQSQQAYADTLLAKHERSNEKKRDGWLRDLGDNTYKASRKAQKKLKLRRLVLG